MGSNLAQNAKVVDFAAYQLCKIGPIVLQSFDLMY
jgi:hypothetical protein